MTGDQRRWLTSRPLGVFLSGRRDADIRVRINGVLVPIRGCKFDPDADAYVITLADEQLADG